MIERRRYPLYTLVSVRLEPVTLDGPFEKVFRHLRWAIKERRKSK